MRLSSFKINLEVLNHIQRRLKALCRPTDRSQSPKVSVKKKHLLMKEIHVFHVRWFISDKGAKQTAAGAAAASGSGNPSQRCVSLLMYSICFGAMHISPHLHRGPSGTSRRHSGDTHTAVAAGTLPGCAAFPSSRRRHNRFVFKHAVAAELRVEAGGLSSRLLQVQCLHNQ